MNEVSISNESNFHTNKKEKKKKKRINCTIFAVQCETHTLVSENGQDFISNGENRVVGFSFLCF